jgi:hypothetical protein
MIYLTLRASAGVQAEFAQNTKEDKEEPVVEFPPNETYREEPSYNQDTHGFVGKIIAKRKTGNIMECSCIWQASKSGKVWKDPTWEPRMHLINVGCKDMTKQFEKDLKSTEFEKQQQHLKKAETVPSYFIISYFQIIFTSSFCCRLLSFSQEDEIDKQ